MEVLTFLLPISLALAIVGIIISVVNVLSMKKDDNDTQKKHHKNLRNVGAGLVVLGIVGLLVSLLLTKSGATSAGTAASPSGGYYYF